MSLIRLNSLINMKHLSSLYRLNVGVRQSGAPVIGRCASSDSKQDSTQQNNDQQLNQSNMQQMPSPAFNQQSGGFPQQQWCPCCCQPTACYMPSSSMQAGMNPGGCNPFCGQQQQQMPMQMSNQMNTQMSSQQYPQFPQFMPMQAHCLPQWNPMENSPNNPFGSMQESSAMCSTYCPECRGPCQPNQTCPRCQGKHNMEPVAEEESAIAEEKPPRNNMPSGSAYTDLFEKKKPAETKE